jgi:hypothetical protein
MVLNGINGDPTILESEDRKIPHLREVNTPLVTRGSASLLTLVTRGVLTSLVRYFTILGFSDGRIVALLPGSGQVWESGNRFCQCQGRTQIYQIHYIRQLTYVVNLVNFSICP